MSAYTLYIGSVLKACAFIMALAAITPVQAHEARPLYVEIIEPQPLRYQLTWRTPPSIPAYNLPSLRLPEDCKSAANAGAPTYNGKALYSCETSLAGRAIAIEYPGANPSVSAMMTLKTANGEEHMGLLGPQEISWTVPLEETKSRVAAHYTKLGVEHIWAGLDHLLFLVCLLWIAGGVKRMLITITGFTVAHSITLALSALEIIRLPVPPVEAAIALSIVFLAREIAVGATPVKVGTVEGSHPSTKPGVAPNKRGRKESLTWRHPIAVSSSFGLLHGLGFAAVLADIGLPQTELLTGLLFFNVGVEIGQVAFVAAIWGAGIAMIEVIKRLGPALASSILSANAIADGGVLRARTELIAAYAVGAIAAFWMIERVAGF